MHAALPGAVRIGEADFAPGLRRQLRMLCHFPPLVIVRDSRRGVSMRLIPILIYEVTAC